MTSEVKDLDKEMKTLKQHMTDHDIKAIDREAHFFIEQGRQLQFWITCCYEGSIRLRN